MNEIDKDNKDSVEATVKKIIDNLWSQCKYCGRLIFNEFNYCPYCGKRNE